MKSSALPVALTIDAACPAYPGVDSVRLNMTFWLKPSLNVDVITMGEITDRAAELERFLHEMNAPFTSPRQ